MTTKFLTRATDLCIECQIDHADFDYAVTDMSQADLLATIKGCEECTLLFDLRHDATRGEESPRMTAGSIYG